MIEFFSRLWNYRIAQFHLVVQYWYIYIPIVLILSLALYIANRR